MTHTTPPPPAPPGSSEPPSSDDVVAPPRQELGTAGRLAAGVSAKGVGVDPDAEGGTPHAGLRLAAMLGAMALIGLLNPWMLVVILAILLMIFLHELGHYVMAKRAGMKVTEFFLGFGPRIWSTRKGETEYGIKVIPAGAYVKIIGMTNLDEVDPADEARTYRQKSFGQRFRVAVAGSTMHFLLAVTLIFLALVAVGQPAGSIDPRVQQRAWVIEEVTAGTGAAAAGLRPGDRIVSIDGEKLDAFEDLRPITKRLVSEEHPMRPAAPVPMVYVRDGKEHRTTLTIKPFLNWNIEEVVKGSAIERAGLEPGDRITSINGHKILFDDTEVLNARLGQLEGEKVRIAYERLDDDGKSVSDTTDVVMDRLLLGSRPAYVGVAADQPEKERIDPVTGLVQAPKQFVEVTGFSLGALGKFFTPGGIKDFGSQVFGAREDAKEAEESAVPSTQHSAAFEGKGAPAAPGENRLLSIYGLVRIGSDIGAVNAAALISLFALINIFIGVFNLVPLLPFDGGHIAVAVYERIQEIRLHRRRYFTDFAKLLPVVYPVVAILGLLFISTLYLDIVNPLSS